MGNFYFLVYKQLIFFTFPISLKIIYSSSMDPAKDVMSINCPSEVEPENHSYKLTCKDKCK